MSLHGIHTIDTAFQRDHFDAAYLIVEDGRGAFVDCGTNHSVPLLLAAVQQAGITPADIDLLIVTHVHLDHAGGAGLLMQQLPNATLVVHPRAAPRAVQPHQIFTLWTQPAAPPVVERAPLLLLYRDPLRALQPCHSSTSRRRSLRTTS